MPQDPIDNGLPCNLEAERILLGAAMVDGGSFPEIAVLQEADFSLESHRKIFSTMIEMNDRGEKIDRVTLMNALNSKGALEGIGISYLMNLDNDTPRIIDLGAYVKIVQEKSDRRMIIFSARNAMRSAALLEEPVAEIISGTTDRLLSLRSAAPQTVYTPGQIINNYPGGMNAFFDANKRERGVQTGFVRFDNMTSGMHAGELLILAARPGHGKAQPLDSKIKTVDGWVSMGDVRVGRELASVDGDHSEVTGVFPRGEMQVYRVIFSDGRSARCGGDHLWEVFYRSWPSSRVVTTTELAGFLVKKRYQGRLWISLHTGDFGSNEILPISPWLMGYLLGNGYLAKGTPQFSTQDQDMVERVDREVESMGLMVTKQSRYQYRIRKTGPLMGGPLHMNPLRLKIDALSLAGVRAQDKFIPERFMLSDRQRRLELLRGLLDSDGTVSKDGQITFCSCSSRLAKDTQELARSLGYWSSMTTKVPQYTYRGERRVGRRAYLVCISSEGKDCVFSNSRKSARLRSSRIGKLVTVSSIISEGVEEMKCISVSHPSGIYITDQYVCTHNSSWAANVACYACGRQRKVTAFFSLEMTKESIVERMACAIGRVDGNKLRLGYLNQEERHRLSIAAGRLDEMSLHIDDSSDLSVAAIRSKCTQIKRKTGSLGLVVIDYLQLMTQKTSRSNDNRTQEVAMITRGLKMLAKDMAVPVLALSQLNRAYEIRRRGVYDMPQLSDLRESGGLENDADLVAFLVLPERYHKDKDELHGLGLMSIAKQRNGPTGMFKLVHLGNFLKFENRAEDQGEFE